MPSSFTNSGSAEEKQVFTINHYYETTLCKVKAAAKKINQPPHPIGFQSGEEHVVDIPKIEEDLELDGGGFLARYAANAATGTADSIAVIELQLSLHCYVKVLLKRLCDSLPLMARSLLMIEPHEILHQLFAEA